MDVSQISNTLKLLRENSKKRKFSQSVDLIINFKNLNLKNPEENINTFVALPHATGKEVKIAAFVGKEIANKAKEVCNQIIHKDDFSEYRGNDKAFKKIAKDIDFFIFWYFYHL